MTLEGYAQHCKTSLASYDKLSAFAESQRWRVAARRTLYAQTGL